MTTGDVLPNGKQIREKEGHYNEYYSPPGFNTKQYFFSPVAAYSSSEVYAPKTKYVIIAVMTFLLVTYIIVVTCEVLWLQMSQTMFSL